VSGVAFLDLTPSHAEIRAELDAAWAEASMSNAFILGPLLERFEDEWADFCGTNHAIGVGSGTDALELILKAMGVGPGDEVVVPAATFVATASAVVAAGATPVFVDVDRDSLLITADGVRSALTHRTAAVLAVHLYGAPVDVDEIRAVTGPAGVPVIEDAAQAHGASLGDRRTGSLSLAAGFSHYPTKNLGAFGDGGSVTTDDDELATRIRSLRNHGRATQSDSVYAEVGRTSRLDGLQAAILSVKLRSLDRWVQQRRDVVGWYDERLPDGVRRVAGSVGCSAPHLCVVRVPERDVVRAMLREQGIGTAIHYADPVPRTPAFGSRAGAFPVAEEAADTMISLPLWPGLTREDVDSVCAALGSVLERRG